MEPSVTRHAQARMRQRGIGGHALEWLLDFGREAFDRHGRAVIYFDKSARRRLARCDAVLSTAGEVETAGQCFRRINRS